MAGIAVFLDTTEYHALQGQLKIAEMKSRFLDVAAHELRSPVTAFSLLLQLTQRQHAKGQPVDSPTLERLHDQVDRISHLIDNLLEATSNIDAVRVYQVLSNLLDNANKYTGADTPIEIFIEAKAELVRVSVKDRGAGIPMEQQKVLFLPFSRGIIGLAGYSEGLGLGLSICRGIITLHGGTIGLTSELGVGSTFYFEIPRSADKT